MTQEIDALNAPPAALAAHLKKLEAAAKTAKTELDLFRRAVRDRYAPYTRTAQPGTYHLAAEDGTPVKVEIREKSKWDSDALAALVKADPRYAAVVRTSYDVLQKDLKRLPPEAQAPLLECVVITREEPTITIGTNTEGEDA